MTERESEMLQTNSDTGKVWGRLCWQDFMGGFGGSGGCGISGEEFGRELASGKLVPYFQISYLSFILLYFQRGVM